MQTLRILSTLCLTLALIGCAAPARVEQMQTNTNMATRTAVDKSPMREAVAIRDVTGGKDTNPMWVSNVSSSDFERALELSLKDAGLLAANKHGSKYVLVAHLSKLDQPFAGASMTVTATVRYILVDRLTNKEVLEKTLATPYTAAWNEAFLGTERLKLANEGAVRANIQQLIDALVALKVASTDVQIGK